MSFIDVVDAGKSPAAFGLFKEEANRRVFPVIGCVLERAVNFVLPRGLLLWFGAGKTLRGICFAFENFGITAQQVILVLYSFDPIGHRQWEFRHLRDRRFITSHDGGFKFLPERRKIVLSDCAFSRL